MQVSVRETQGAQCPKCLVDMDIRRIPPRGDVSYVRDRAWLTCPTCGRTAVVDR